MKFLNGFKTILGIAMTVGGIVIPALGKDPNIVTAVGNNLSGIADHLAAVVTGGGAILTTLGIIHKREKAKAGQ